MIALVSILQFFISLENFQRDICLLFRSMVGNARRRVRFDSDVISLLDDTLDQTSVLEISDEEEGGAKALVKREIKHEPIDMMGRIAELERRNVNLTIHCEMLQRRVMDNWAVDASSTVVQSANLDGNLANESTTEYDGDEELDD